MGAGRPGRLMPHCQSDDDDAHVRAGCAQNLCTPQCLERPSRCAGGCSSSHALREGGEGVPVTSSARRARATSRRADRTLRARGARQSRGRRDAAAAARGGARRSAAAAARGAPAARGAGGAGGGTTRASARCEAREHEAARATPTGAAGGGGRGCDGRRPWTQGRSRGRGRGRGEAEAAKGGKAGAEASAHAVGGDDLVALAAAAVGTLPVLGGSPWARDVASVRRGAALRCGPRRTPPRSAAPRPVNAPPLAVAAVAATSCGGGASGGGDDDADEWFRKGWGDWGSSAGSPKDPDSPCTAWRRRSGRRGATARASRGRAAALSPCGRGGHSRCRHLGGEQ